MTLSGLKDFHLPHQLPLRTTLLLQQGEVHREIISIVNIIIIIIIIIMFMIGIIQTSVTDAQPFN